MCAVDLLKTRVGEKNPEERKGLYSQVLEQWEPIHVCSEREAQEDDFEHISGSSHKHFQEPILQWRLVSMHLSRSLVELNWYRCGSKKEKLTAKLRFDLSLKVTCRRILVAWLVLQNPLLVEGAPVVAQLSSSPNYQMQS